MANPEHLEKLKEGVGPWNQWRQKHPEIRVDLHAAEMRDMPLNGIDLHDANLTRAFFHDVSLADADLHGANLSNANLDLARLENADLRDVLLIGADLGRSLLNRACLRRANLAAAFCWQADFQQADLTGANLHFANFSEALIDGACLEGASLTGVNLRGAILNDTNFDDATISYAVFGDNDLSTVMGLIKVEHLGPSTIGIDTIYRSKGNIPDSFLRGCGVPETLITFAKSLVVSPVEFYSCFISYSNRDDAFAAELHGKLQAQQVRCWKDSEDLKIGDKFQEVIENAIRLHDKLLVVLSENSVNSSWVEREVQSAFEKEQRQGSTVLFPVRLDDAVMDCTRAWAADIRRTRHIGDFRKWKDHDSFQKSLDRLLRDLKSQDSISK